MKPRTLSDVDHETFFKECLCTMDMDSLVVIQELGLPETLVIDTLPPDSDHPDLLELSTFFSVMEVDSERYFNNGGLAGPGHWMFYERNFELVVSRLPEELRVEITAEESRTTRFIVNDEIIAYVDKLIDIKCL